MGHSVHLIVGRGQAIASFLRQWPGARAVDLLDGWQAIPVDHPLHDAIEAKHPGAERPPELDVSPRGLDQALSAATEAGGGLAYVETDYFGGSGGQSAMAFADGAEAMSPQRSRGGGGPINQSLRRIGVTRTEADDEFDTVGIGERRSMDDYEPEGPVRLRGAPQPVVETTPAASRVYLPTWLVIFAMAAAVGAGIMLAITR